jgi:hypothetical protein
MRRTPLLLLAFLILSLFDGVVVKAICPHECSGHGFCEDYDICECYDDDVGRVGWIGNDCSMRTCPYGEAWIGPLVKANDVHPMMECSNKGLCDRDMGTCKCFPNFQGVACERSICPNYCSERGQCYSARQLAENADRSYNEAWDADKNFGCVCDLGFRGPDCSERECPSGKDPMGAFGNESGRDCSGRGLCDYDSGKCECFDGFHGARCDIQDCLF